MSEDKPADTSTSFSSFSSVVPEREFDDFYRAHFRSLTAFLLMQGASLVEASDIVQDTMFEAYRCWDRIDHPRAWAYRVASKTFVRRKATVAENLVADPPEPAPPLRGSDIEHWEQRHDLLVVLAGLPHRQQQVMAWTLSGFRPAEIADELRITAEAVRSSLVKARRTLSARLAGGDL